MKKILIFTSSHGHGHIATANALKAALEAYHSHRIEVEIADPLDEIRRHWNRFISTSYNRTIKYAPMVYKLLFEATDSRRIANAFGKFIYVFNKKELANYLTSKNADLVVINFAGYVEIFGLVVEEHLPHLPLVCLVTDSISIHNGWVGRQMDYYLVANSDTANSLEKLGAPPSKIQTLGYPVSLKFSQPFDRIAFLRQHKLDPTRPTVLFLPITDKILRTKKIIRTISALGQFNIIVITGRNQEIYDKLTDYQKRYNFRLVGWTDQMPDFIMGSDIVVTKAGGSTVMECIAAQKPLVIHHIIPGQEEGNAEFVTKHQLGLVELDPSQIAPAVASIMKHRTTYQKNLQQHAQPEATVKIADFIADIL